MYRYLFLAPLITLSSLHALVEQNLNDKMPIEITLSHNSHNRISVEGGSVKLIFADETIFSVTLDPITGNAFVTLLRPIESIPATLTVFTSAGNLQDLLIRSEEKTSEHLILKEAGELEDLTIKGDIFHSPTIEFLNTILEGKTPLGYGTVSLDQSKPISLPSPLRSQTMKVLEGPFETIIVYQIHNEGRKPVVLSSDLLKTSENAWVFLTAHQLKRGEDTICIISYPKAGAL